ncbi:MAG: hypothetical protein PVG49_11515 [Desulfobacteraceae bacterium]
MTFPARKRELLPWVIVAFIGAALGRNLCHHAGWPWWIGFTLVPAGVVLAGAGLHLLIGKRAGLARKSKRGQVSRNKR